jgi:SagB-type dehydrogenase family enzyme
MYMDFSGLFHRSSKDLSGGGTVRIPQDETQWPEEWSTAYYKAYPRLAKIPLPATSPSSDFFEHIRTRHTDRRFRKDALTPERLSTLLKYSCGITHEYPDWNPRRAQPSGGARYPIEAYPVLFRDAGTIPAGVYHYNIKEHALDMLSERPFSNDDIAQLATYPWVEDASMLLILTAVFWRSQMKYGERGYRYVLLEAGHIGQNVYLTSMALGLKCCGLGGTRDENIEKILGVDGVDESLVYALVVG